MKCLNMSYSDVKKLPIRYRQWYIDRHIEHVGTQKREYEKKQLETKISSKKF